MMTSMRNRASPGDETARFIRFLVIGAVNAGAGYAIFIVLYSLAGVNYLFANALTFALWSFPGFELQRRWVFQSAQGFDVFVRFLSAQIIFLAVGTGLLYLAVDWLSLSPELAYIVVLGLIAVLIYLSSRFVVFRPGRDQRCETG